MPMEYIWDPEFDVISAAIAKDARAAAAVEEVAAAAADESAKLPQEKNNNRNGALLGNSREAVSDGNHRRRWPVYLFQK